MKVETPWSLIAPLGVCALLVGWVMLSAAKLQTASFSLLILGLANLIVYTDALDFILRLHVRRRHIATAPTEENRYLSIDVTSAMPIEAQSKVPVRPYAIIASIFNLEPLLDEFMDAFAPYRDRVWLISDGSTDETVLRLRQAGWRCFDEGVNRRKPGALRRLLMKLPSHIDTVMVVDPDLCPVTTPSAEMVAIVGSALVNVTWSGVSDEPSASLARAVNVRFSVRDVIPAAFGVIAIDVATCFTVTFAAD